MDIPKDLGQRIVEAARLAVMLHMQHELRSQSIPGGTGRETGRAFLPIGGAAMDGGDFTPLPAPFTSAGTLAAGKASAARGGASAAECEVA
jgi:hypothetical protein